MLAFFVPCFSSLEVFTFPSYFSLRPALHPGFSGPRRPSPALPPRLLLVPLLLRDFSVTVLPRALRFWEGIFYPEAFFTSRSFTDIFGTFCDSDASRNTESRILLSACPHRVAPSDWRMDLNNSYCSYKNIDLSIAPVSHELYSWNWTTEYVSLFQSDMERLKKCFEQDLMYCLKLLRWTLKLF